MLLKNTQPGDVTQWESGAQHVQGPRFLLEKRKTKKKNAKRMDCAGSHHIQDNYVR